MRVGSYLLLSMANVAPMPLQGSFILSIFDCRQTLHPPSAPVRALPHQAGSSGWIPSISLQSGVEVVWQMEFTKS